MSRSGRVIALTGWRLLIAACALVGFTLGGPLEYLSQLGSLLAGVVYLGLAGYPLLSRGERTEPRSSWLRGAVAVVLVLVCLGYLLLQRGTLTTVDSMLEHLVTPALVVLDWLFVGRSQAGARWWYPLTWLAPPTAYLVFYLLNGEVLYGFLDPGSAGFAGMVGGLLAGVLAAGYLLVGLGRLRRAAADSTVDAREVSSPVA